MKMFFMSAIIAEAESSSSGSCAELTSCSAVPQSGLFPASAVRDRNGESWASAHCSNGVWRCSDLQISSRNN